MRRSVTKRGCNRDNLKHVTSQRREPLILCVFLAELLQTISRGVSFFDAPFLHAAALYLVVLAYQRTKFRMPVSTVVLGRYPTSCTRSRTSAAVSGTSPGCNGRRLSSALRPTFCSMSSMYRISGVACPSRCCRCGTARGSSPDPARPHSTHHSAEPRNQARERRLRRYRRCR